jgi:8-oxo-dGTP diphosphatase
MLEVALAMVEQEGKWLLQLRDDLDWIVAPGCWGLFGGHLEPGETAEEALTTLIDPLDTLRLQEGQDVLFADIQALQSGRVWSPAIQEFRPFAPSLQLAIKELNRGSQFSMGG